MSFDKSEEICHVRIKDQEKQSIHLLGNQSVYRGLLQMELAHTFWHKEDKL